MAKCSGSDMAAMRVTTAAVQVFGGYGKTMDDPVRRMMRNAKLTQISRAPIRSSAWSSPANH